ncbi:helix-turn-helix domain-containing protein [Streptomyces sp. NPDC048362]|uniref:helix-turn-helix domain-containing protein n=1 Tax=Streptomyces sp. NPDC048362 TaxID=3365539 RepID=UPI00371E7FCA
MASVYGHQTPPQARRRAAIVLPAARGCPSARIAARSRMHVDTVRTWRGGFAAGGPAALSDRRRSGRPPSFTSPQVTEVNAPACQSPDQTGAPLSPSPTYEILRRPGCLIDTRRTSGADH